MSSRVLAAALALGAVAAGCTAAKPTPPHAVPVVVGVLVDTSGQGPGADAVRGSQLAAELVNGTNPELELPLAQAAGLPGLGGAQVQVEVAETGGDPDAAEAATDQLLAGGQEVAGLVTVDDPDVVAASAAYATRQGVATLDVSTSAEFLLDLGLEWYFRTGPTDRTLAETAFALLEAQPPPCDDRAVLLTPASEGGGVMASLVPGLARAAGFPVAETIEVTGAGDIDATLRLSQASPAVVVAASDTAAGARQVRELLADLDSPPPAMELGAGYRHLAGGSPQAVRPVGWSDEFAGRHPLAAAVAGLYEQRFEQPLTGPAAAGFTGVMTVAAAANAAGAGDSAAVRVALRQLDLPATGLVMPWRGIHFLPNGQNDLAAAVVEQRNGQGWQVVFPPELAAGTVAWPNPPEQETGL